MDLLKVYNISKNDLIDKVAKDIMAEDKEEWQITEEINFATDYINNNRYKAYTNNENQLVVEIMYEQYSLPLTYIY